MISLVIADITTLNVQAIVNAANPQLRRGNGVCGAIFSKAGDDLDSYCNSIVIKQSKEGKENNYRCKTGNAIITPAFGLTKVNPSIKYIIHAVGPIYTDGNNKDEMLLQNAYLNSIKVANSCNVNSIAFPFISSGIYGYPVDECAKIAMNTLKSTSTVFSGDITMCAYNQSDFKVLGAYM
jgi:O-acetyl-ADP-ribose deacetylase (regulator of RNase III)